MLCAIVFGKEEETAFTFSQDSVDEIMIIQKNMFSGELAPYVQPPAHYLTPVVHLCISDANKIFLVRGKGLLPLLLDGLLLEPDHVRKDHPANIKAAIQADAASCFLQMACFEPGRVLLSENERAMAALRALAGGKALTAEAKISANGALMAIDLRISPSVTERARKPGSYVDRVGSGEERDGHVMLSYQWDHQTTIERVARSLQARGYRTWFGA